MRHIIGAGIVIAGATMALACSPATSPFDVAGTYSLVSVNGSPLPYILSNAGGEKVEVLDDIFTLYPGGTFAERGHKRITTGGGISIAYPVDAGNFSRRGEAIKLESLLFPARSASVRNGLLTLIDQQITFVYTK